MRNIFTGVVENRDDPLKLGRCQVRVVGLHTEDKITLPTAELPWAFPMQPVSSASINGIGWTPVGPVPGTWVVIMFHDDEYQMPVMIGTLGGIPQSKASERILDTSDNLVTDGGVVTGSDGSPVKSKDGTDVTIDGGVKNLLGNAAAQIGQVLGINLNGGLKGLFNNAGGLQVESVGAADERAETVTPKIVPAEESKITAQPEPAKADDKVLAADINVDPPAKYAPSDKAKAKKCIQAIIAACDQIGLTSKYAKCSILGICGGESKWLPLEEGHSYSADSLLKVFPGVFKGDAGKAAQYARWQGSKADFFREIYSPKYKNGQGAGNKQPDDGALFYGRGFNQITGRALYEQLERELKKIGVDAPISKQPDILINDIDKSALCTAMFYKLNVKHPIDDPGYFQAALKRTGNPVGDSYEKKKILYEYFLGQGVIADSTNKPAADGQKTYTQAEVQYLPKSKQMALLEDRSDVATVGFKDPSGKYPLRNLMDEPDTNRLARGIIKETAVEFKDQTRTSGIPLANDGSSWEQPLAPFGGEYPYSKVFESESGHLQVFDDTPGHETISFYHRKGTFIDVDANGTQVNKIVGDGYTVIDRNGMIQIAGRCNLHVGNSVNIYVEGNADIEVNGVTNANFHGDVNLGCARDVNWAIGGDFNLKVDGKFSTTVIGDTNTSCDANISTQAKANISFNSEAAITTQATSNITVKTEALYALEAGDEVSFKTAAAMKTQADGEYTVKVGSDLRINAGGDSKITASGNFDLNSAGASKVTGTEVHLKALGGAVNMDGTAFRAQQGTSQVASKTTAPSGNTVDSFDKFAALTLAAPEFRPAAGDSFDILQTPVRPSPPVELKTDLENANNTALEDFQKNPGKYYNPEAEAGGVNPNRPPQPDIGDAGKSLPPSGAGAGDIQAFLTKQLALAKEGFWAETGMKDKNKSNPNILSMWKDIGMQNVCGGSDQTAWCMAFVNWTLKQNNYRYAQSARAFDIRDRTEKWKATKVSDPQPGDICVWSYSHVNFVYEVKSNGTCTFVGGNQGGGKVTDNNPSGGSVTISYAGGASKSHPNIVGFYRPSKD